jgi:hypothetical protein
MAKKETDAEHAPETKVEFSREKLLSMERYAGRADLLTALLKPGKRYTFEAVDAVIAKFLKGAN